MPNATAHHAGEHLRGAARLGFAVFLFLHGVAHFAGTTGDVTLIRTGGAAALVGGAWSVSSPVALGTLAVAWAATGAVFLVAASLVWTRAGHAWTVLQVVTCVSLLLSAVSLWSAIAGVVIDVVLLALATAGHGAPDPSPAHSVNPR